MRRSVFVLVSAIACGPAGGPSGGKLAIEGEQSSTTLGNQTQKPETKPDDPDCVDATLEALREEIFVPRCATAGCHVGEAARADLDLSVDIDALRERLAASATQSATGMPLVTPGQPGASYLYLKVFLESPLVGAQMPKDGMLEDCEIDAIRRFIAP